MKRRCALILSVTGILLPVPTAGAAEPTGLRQVMQDMGRDMQTISGGIAREDWTLVGATAPRIASHPQPPMSERMRIVSFMGARMPEFKSFDMQTHEAAHELEHAAHEKNGQGVIDAFHKVQTSCLGCHQAFRASFVKHFYGSSAE